MEEIFEVNANKDIEGMDACDFTKDKSLTPAPSKNQRLHPPVTLHQKSIPPRHPSPYKNNLQKKNPNPKP